jgi:proton-dependent oligopeptide transporter, POT family
MNGNVLEIANYRLRESCFLKCQCQTWRIMRDLQSHSRSLFGLSIIEFWERFSFYSLSYLLPLYMTDSIGHGGMGCQEPEVLFWVGIYGFFAWSSPLLGGIIADRYLNLLSALIIGGLMIMSGHLVLFFINPQIPLILLLGLALICAGTGLFKPSITALVGQIYQSSYNYKEKAYSLYYSAINLGILASGVGGGIIIARFGYHWGFSVAGLGMTAALVWFFAEYPTFRTKFRTIRIYDTQPSLLIPTPSEVRLTLFFSYICSWLWGTVYFLGIGGFLMFLIKGYTDRQIGSFVIPLSWFPSLSPLFLTMLTFLFNLIWRKMALRGKEPSSFVKLAFGQLLCASTLLILVLALTKIGNLPENTQVLGFGTLILFYLIGVLGEIFTCPISYSLISSVSRTHNMALLQAVCFACYGLGSITAGSIGAKYFSDHSLTFTVGIAALTLAIFVIMLRIAGAFTFDSENRVEDISMEQ